jgi:N-carbamoylputrescine amidase
LSLGGAESPIKIGCCQLEPRVGRKEENLKKTLRFIEEAAGMGSNIVLLPELANTGYVFESRREAFQLSEEVPGGETTSEWMELSRSLGIYVVGGLAERDGNALYNTSVLLGPDGFLGKYRKLHLWDREKLFFEPGDLGLPVFQAPVGRLSMCICYDLWFPETIRILSLRGADIVLVPTNWVCVEDRVEEGRLVEALCTAQAHMNGVFIAAADRVGVERGQSFLGRSMILSPRGRIIGGPASFDNEEIVYADLNLTDSRLKKRRTSLNHILLDRRIDVYEALLGYEGSRFTF